MSDELGSEPAPDGVEPAAPVPEPDWRRRRRLAEVFGEVRPDTTSDERDDEDTRSVGREKANERWLQEQVPPHHVWTRGRTSKP